MALLTRHVDAALVPFDYCLTFDQEVEQIWRKRINLSSALFLINRYTTIVAILTNNALELFPPTLLLPRPTSFPLGVVSSGGHHC
ncbi:hypothetical protein C8Q75DRAFT_423117 [Abortiporus biennis]|nr:hypothetical protein C8Q75DRAFT_423117 [Abortiporus biennis]